METNSLKQKTISGVKWQFVNKMMQKAISVATFAVLARMLEPSVFGLFAMAFILIDGLSLFHSFGLDTTIVQKRDCPQKMLHTAFFLTNGFGLMIFLLCNLAAPVAGYFFKNAEVVSVVRALGLIFIVGCFGKIPRAILAKQMRFRLLSTIEIIGSLTNTGFVIFFAFFSPTVWSLVWAYVIKNSVSTFITWYCSGYRLRFVFDKASAKELLDFGKFLVGSSVVYYLNANFGMALVGKILGSVMVGYYSLARNISAFINTHFTQLISDVTFPAFSEIQNDRPTLKRVFLRTIKFVSIFTLPFSICLIFLAKEFTLTLYGEKWLLIVPLVQLMGVSQFVLPLIASTGSIFKAAGFPQYDYRIALFSFLVEFPLTLFFTYRWGVVGTVGSTVIGDALFLPFYFVLLRRVLGLGLSEIFGQIRPALFCSLLMALAIVGVKSFVQAYSFFGQFAFQTIVYFFLFALVGAMTYAAAFFFVDRSSTQEVKRIILGLERV